MKLIKFTNGEDVYFINPEQVSTVHSAGERRSEIWMQSGMVHPVDGASDDVVARLEGVRP